MTRGEKISLRLKGKPKSLEHREKLRAALLGRNPVWAGIGVAYEADHIKPFAYFPELRLDVNNGQTLCKDCHKKTPTWGERAKNYAITSV